MIVVLALLVCVACGESGGTPAGEADTGAGGVDAGADAAAVDTGADTPAEDPGAGEDPGEADPGGTDEGADPGGADEGADTGADTVEEPVVVGPEGGTEDLPEGGTIEVPKDAVDEEVGMTIRPVEAPESDLFEPAGPFFEFGPAGLEFSTPATVTLPYSPDKVPAGATPVMAWSTSDGGWELLPATVKPGDMLAAKVAHFSIGGAAVPVQTGDTCCVVVDPAGGAVSSVGSEESCASAGGTAAGDAAACAELVCCAVSAGGITQVAQVPSSFCTTNGGETLAADQCGPVCCYSFAGGAPGAEMRDLAECDAVGGQGVGDEAACGDWICCDLGDAEVGFAGAMPLPRAACEAAGGDEDAEGECTKVCCLKGDPSSFAASVETGSQCSAAGGIAMGGVAACDKQVCCSLGVAAALNGGGPVAFVLPEELCNNGGGSVVDAAQCDTVCCLQAHGTLAAVASVKTRTDCAAQGGVAAGDASACASQVCCSLGAQLGMSTAAVVPQATCDDAGGTVLDSASCEQVCCARTDGLGVNATVMLKAGCEELGGMNLGDASLCADQVCCSVGMLGGLVQAVTVPAPLCDQAGGTAVDAEQCEEVCCVAGDGQNVQAVVVARSMCEAHGGTIAGGAEDCGETVCCGASALGMTVATMAPQDDCLQLGGQILERSMCDATCCLLNGQALTMGAWACDNAGGTPVGEAADCEDLVCCSAGGVAGMIPTSVCNDGGILLDASACEDVCCILDGGSEATVTMGADCTTRGGTPAGDASACEDLVCCTASVMGMSVAALMPRTLCEQGGTVAEAEECERVCCVSMDGAMNATTAKASRSDCSAVGGTPVGSADACDETVCCSVGGLGFSASMMIPAALCEQAGTPTDAADCEGICCLLSDGSLNAASMSTSRGTCASAGGLEVGAAEDCDNQVCCSISGFGMSMAVMVPAAACEQGGTPVDASNCEEVCCLSGDGLTEVNTLTTSRSACESAGGMVAPEGVDCDDQVCCSVGALMGISMAVVVPRAICETAGTPTDAEDCDDVCCIVSDGTMNVQSQEVPRGACESHGGMVAPEGTDCDDLVCCTAGFGGFSMMIPAGLCESLGTPTEAEDCEEVCCVVSDGGLNVVAQNAPRSACESAGGMVAPEGVDCDDQVCCGFSIIGSMASVVPRAMCEMAGTPLEAEDCEEVCCLFGEQKVYIARHACVENGGTEAENQADCDEECQTRYDCERPGVCEEVYCPNRVCEYEYLPDGTPCDDSDPETTSSECEAGFCVCKPDCEGKDCGPDGCGGDCGPCPDGTACQGGSCVESSGGPCTPASADFSGDYVSQAHVAFDPDACTCAAGSGYGGAVSIVLDYFSDNGQTGGSPEPPWVIEQTEPDIGSGQWLENVPLDTPIVFTLKHPETGKVVRITLTLTTTGIVDVSIDC